MKIAEVATRGAKWTAISSATIAIVDVVKISIVARILNPEDFGVVALIMVILAIANVFVIVGFSDALVVNSDATKKQLSTMYWLNALFGLSAYCILYIGSPLLFLVIERDNIVVIARIMAITLLMGAAISQFNALMKRELHLKSLAIIAIIERAIGCAVAVIMAYAGEGIWSLIAAELISNTFRTISILSIAVKNRWLPSFYFDLLQVTEMIRFGTYRICAAILNAIYSRSDQLMIGIMLGQKELGYYTVALNLSMQPFNKINPILTQVTFPLFAKIRNDDLLLLRGYRKGVRLLSAINAPLLFGLIAVAPTLIPAFLGHEWTKSIQVTQIMSIFVLLRSIGNINIGLILAKGKYQWPFYLNIFLVIAIPTVILIVAKISSSLSTVCWAVVSVQLLVLIITHIVFTRRLLGSFTGRYLDDIGRPVISATIMSLSVYWTQSICAIESKIISLTFSILIGTVLYSTISIILQPRHLKEIIWLWKSKM